MLLHVLVLALVSYLALDICLAYAFFLGLASAPIYGRGCGFYACIFGRGCGFYAFIFGRGSRFYACIFGFQFSFFRLIGRLLNDFFPSCSISLT
jgi:hypothetical protein